MLCGLRLRFYFAVRNRWLCGSSLLKSKGDPSGWLYLAVAIVTEVIGTSALAPSQGFTKPVPTIIVLISYAAAFYLLSQTLHTIPVAVAYAVWSGAGVALITLIAWAMFGQRLDAFALLGIGLIVAGVLVIRILSDASAH